MKNLIFLGCLCFSYATGYGQTVRITNNPVRYSDPVAKQTIDSIYSRLQRGDDFDALATRLSQDPGSFSVGGSLGWQKPAVYVNEFRDMLNELRINQVSKPFKTAFGYHIVQLLDRQGGNVLSRHILLRLEE